MEGLNLPCGIGFKWPRMALPCQCLVFNVLSGLVAAAELLTETDGAGSVVQDLSSTRRTAEQRHINTPHSLMSRLVNYSPHSHSLLRCI